MQTPYPLLATLCLYSSHSTAVLLCPKIHYNRTELQPFVAEFSKDCR